MKDPASAAGGGPAAAETTATRGRVGDDEAADRAAEETGPPFEPIRTRARVRPVPGLPGLPPPPRYHEGAVGSFFSFLSPLSAVLEATGICPLHHIPPLPLFPGSDNGTEVPEGDVGSSLSRFCAPAAVLGVAI
eukprot:CAMPEP_0194328126 /NCGR_PEP_ID=MMETSP0171-20130528/43563_1 /TAXON_ID=218684 /ORGANISM="Corethron pennatum, Strain L29A3" /LENGTH=133 /DNA_ID=CAMNT_0039088345 /DNA_START=198 /DNA_END=598 /DNA_ORIENTATION=-